MTDWPNIERYVEPKRVQLVARDIDLEPLIKCAEREAALRERVYPRWVAAGRMKQEKADREIALMRAIAAYLRELVKCAERTGSGIEASGS